MFPHSQQGGSRPIIIIIIIAIRMSNQRKIKLFSTHVSSMAITKTFRCQKQRILQLEMVERSKI